MKQMLLSHKRWLVGGLLVAAVCVVAWFAGPLFAFGEARPLDTVAARLVFCALAVGLWLAFELARVLLARARNRRLAQGLAAGAQTESLSQQERAVLQQRFAQAMRTLAATRLGGAGRSQWLYQLPWYMFIGAPGSGKTTALVNSGLRFPLAASGGAVTAVGGVGGTRNCDWWFTDQAVLIDTAGRYTTQDSQAAVDHAAWSTFLGLLKRHRPRQPINGVIVTVSVSDLLVSSAAERQHYATVVRQRVDDLQRELGLAYPVYVMVTKCDLVAGFDEFFASFDAEQRAQVWGITFDLDARLRPAGNPREAFERGFPALVDTLNDVLLSRLAEERDAERRARMYPFPQQFAALAPLLAEFLDLAFADSKFSDRAFVRGVYFTSGTQEGAPVDRLLASLSRSLELRAPSTRRPGAMPATAGRSYFIQRLLTQVIFPEAGLAGHSERREAALRRLNWGVAALALLAGTGLLVAWTLSYLANREGLERAAPAAADARQALARVGPPAAGDLPALVDALNRLREVPQAVHRPVDDPPWRMTWGLYQGGKVAARVDERYRFALQQGLLPRLALQLESIMAAPQSRPEAVYAALKAYLMMYDARHLDEGFFLGTVTELWQSAGMDRGLVASAREHLEQLVLARDLQLAKYHPRNEQLVAQARSRAGALSLADRAYGLLRLSGASGGEWRASEVLGPIGLSVLERASGVSLSEPVPAIYTRQAYRDAVKPRVKDLVRQLGAEEGWVLGGRASGGAPVNMQEFEVAVLRRYLADYQATWDGLLRDIRVRRLDSARAAMDAAQVLSQPDSPLKRLVQSVAEQTRLTATDARAGAASAAQEQATRKAREAAAGATSGIFGSQAAQVVGAVIPTADPVRALELAVEEHFAGLRRLAGEGKGGEMEAATAVLQEIFNELVAVQQKAASGQGVKEMPPGLLRAKAQAQRFNMPVSGVITALTGFAEQEASGGIRKEIKAGVGGASSMCQRAVPGRYPFAKRSPQDAGVQDFVNVFKAGGDLDTFFNTNLAAYVDKSGGVWRLKASGEGAPPVSPATLRQFQNAEAIRTAFLNGGATPSVVVDVGVVAGDAEVGIEYDGASHKLRAGAPGVRLAWPARPGAKLLINGQPVVSAEGPWALFRLVDKGTPDPSAVGDRLRVTYGNAAGARATLEWRTGSAAFNPLRLRELEAFSCPRE